MQIVDILQFLEVRAPSFTAESWDNVGLLVGDPQWEAAGAVVSIDLTKEAIDLALQHDYRLIITHHPCIFPATSQKGYHGLARITPDESLIFQSLQKKISVLAIHTNFDHSSMEVIDLICKGLGLEYTGRLLNTQSSGVGGMLKLATFVPESHLESVRLALCEAGAGHIGNYDSCTFSSQGEGTFRGKTRSQPFIGKEGRLEKVREFKLETIFSPTIQKKVLSALFSSHPYEEIAYDLISLEKHLPYGFYGDYSSPLSLDSFSQRLISLFRVPGFLLTTALDTKFVRKIGFVAGKGVSFLEQALAVGCDLFLTGEVGYHAAFTSMKRGLSVIELGHCESERFFIDTLERWFAELGLSTISIRTSTQKLWLGGI